MIETQPRRQHNGTGSVEAIKCRICGKPVKPGQDKSFIAAGYTRSRTVHTKCKKQRKNQ